MKQLVNLLTKVTSTSLALGFCACIGAANAAVITVNTADNTDFGVGKTNLVYALTNIADGDTIAFNIPGDGPHYLQTPPNGYPLLIKDRVTLDGYSQPGASANTNPITSSNNAVIKIVLDSRNGNFRDMEYTAFTLGNSSPPIDNTAMSSERGGYGFPERAVLGIYRATNVTVRGFALLGVLEESAYGIAVAHDYGLDTTVKDRFDYNEGSSRNCHINGCWFGIDPTNQTVAGLAPFADGIAFFRHRDVSGAPRPELPNEALIVGVKQGSSNPRAEFNVFAYMAYAMAGEAVRTRFSGNFLGVMPDGVTPTGIPSIPGAFQAGIEIGRYNDTQPIVFGTDGDGVNDADEGNLFGPLLDGNVVLGLYSTGDKPYIVAGNRFGMAVDGTIWTNAQVVWDSIGSTTKVQFGSDFDGVSDDLEANVVYNNVPWSVVGADVFTAALPKMLVISPGARVSMRGNSLVNNTPVPFQYADQLSTQLVPFTNYCAPYMSTNGIVIPVISSNSTAANIIGMCALTNGSSYTNIIIDVYAADPEGWTNGMPVAGALYWPMMTDVTTYTNGWAQGRTYYGSFVDNGPQDLDLGVGTFNLQTGSLGIPGGTLVTVTANYSMDPPGTTHGATHTSEFSMPVPVLQPLMITSATRSGSTLTITWAGGNPPFTLQRKGTIGGTWSTVASGLTGNSTTANMTGDQGYYQIIGN